MLRRGVRLGIATNNVAEAEALAAAMREAVRWHFQVLETLTQCAQRMRNTTWVEI